MDHLDAITSDRAIKLSQHELHDTPTPAFSPNSNPNQTIDQLITFSGPQMWEHNRSFDGHYRKLVSDTKLTLNMHGHSLGTAITLVSDHIGGRRRRQSSCNGDDAEEHERELVQQHGVNREW